MLRRDHGRIIQSAIVLAAAFAAFAGCSNDGTSRDAGKEPARLTVLFASDMLGKIRSCGCVDEDAGGLARRASYTKLVRERTGNVLVLDAGDDFSLDLAYTKEEASLTLEAFSIMGVDVLTPGENEFIFGLPFLQAAAENATFTMLAANVVDPESGEPVFGDEYIVHELPGGVRLAITGVLDETIRFPSYIDRSLFRVEPAAATLRRLVPRMRREADFLILLSHLGIDRTKSLLGEVEGFDVAVIGHGKPLMKKTETVGKTLLLGTGGQGRYLGRIDLRFDASGTMRYGTMQLINLGDEYPRDPEVVELFREYQLPLTDKEAGVH
jgi:5'-nucleotidase / UDP-sugar diphosphatase